MNEDFSDEVEKWLKGRSVKPLPLMTLMENYVSAQEGDAEELEVEFERSVSNYLRMIFRDAQTFLEESSKSVDPETPLHNGMMFAAGFLRGAADELDDVVDGVVPFAYFDDTEEGS